MTLESLSPHFTAYLALLNCFTNTYPAHFPDLCSSTQSRVLSVLRPSQNSLGVERRETAHPSSCSPPGEEEGATAAWGLPALFLGPFTGSGKCVGSGFSAFSGSEKQDYVLQARAL